MTRRSNISRNDNRINQYSARGNPFSNINLINIIRQSSDSKELFSSMRRGNIISQYRLAVSHQFNNIGLTNSKISNTCPSNDPG
jgi:hypothetical protein